MNGSPSSETQLSSCLPEKQHFNIRDANGQIVFSYGTESEPITTVMFENKIEQIIEFAASLLNCFYDSKHQPNNSLITIHKFLSNIICNFNQSSQKITPELIITALILINRLKTLNPNCRGSGSSGHRLLLAALLLASKMTMDDTYDNKSWAYVSAGLFDLDEVNQMEMEFLAFIDFQVFVSPVEWMDFAVNIAKKTNYLID